MPDIVNLQAEDWQENRGWYTLYLPDNSPDFLVSQIRDLLVPMTSGLPFLADQVINRVDLPPLGQQSSTGKVSQAARLTFITATTFWSTYILAPVPGCFFPNGDLDENFAPVADVIAWLLANGVTSEGEPLTGFSQGELVSLVPGFVAVNGAAAGVRRGNFVCSFWPQDGADIHLVDEDL